VPLADFRTLYRSAVADGRRLRAKILTGLAAMAVAAVVLLHPPTASAVGTTILARWTFTISGSMDYRWASSSRAPCGAVGSGGVVLRFRGYKAWDVLVQKSPYTGKLLDYRDQTPLGVRFQGTVTDGRVQNPPPPVDPSVGGAPQCTAGFRLQPKACPRFDELFAVPFDNDVYKTPGRAVLRSAINPLGDCFTAGFFSLTRFIAAQGQLNNPGDYPITIGYPTIGQLTSSRGPLTFTANDAVRVNWFDEGGPGHIDGTARRHVVMRFTRSR